MLQLETKLDGIRQKVFLDRYSLKDPQGNPTEMYPEEMWTRVARGIAAVEETKEKRQEWEEKFYSVLKDFQFVPAGRILSGAGAGYQVTFFNCFVVPPPEDSINGIMDCLKTMSQIMRRGGGVGINFSSLRPRDTYVKSVNGTASGPVPFIHLFSETTGKVIIQSGTRRGALMSMLDDNHPDVEEFITAKKTKGYIEHSNISVCISDAFMTAVKDDADWNLTWQGEVKKTVRARYLWDLICTSAWESAEPGLVFMERGQRESNTWYYEHIRCVNPCGEQLLPAFGVCNLGAVNLANFVEHQSINLGKLRDVVKIAMRFLDNVIDATPYFIPENEEAQKGTRRTGLGTMGLADALIKMQVPYGSEGSLPIIEKIYEGIRNAAYEASVEIAKEKGPFPKFDRDKYLQGKFIERLPEDITDQIGRYGIRNAVLLTQAPTGTTSLLAGVSSGIEPVYDFAMIRRDRTGEHVLYHPLLQDWRDAHPGEEQPDYFVCSKDLTPEEHVRVQATIQKYTDASISKTTNAPNSHTVEQVQKLYMLAYEMGCKGITYYRDGSRDAVLTRIEDTKKSSVPEVKVRPAVVHGYTRQVNAPEGKVNVTINSDDSGPLEVFVNVGKAGSDIAALSEALGRLISFALQMPSTLSQELRVQGMIKQLRGIGGSRSVGFGAGQVRSLPDAVARALELHAESTNEPHVTHNLCQECGCQTMVYEEGCKKCHSCGYSEC